MDITFDRGTDIKISDHNSQRNETAEIQHIELEEKIWERILKEFQNNDSNVRNVIIDINTLIIQIINYNFSVIN